MTDEPDRSQAERSERELDLEARVIALEYLLKQCFWQVVLVRAAREGEDAENWAIRDVKQFRKVVLSDLQAVVFPGFDPAVSDHVAALVREHAGRFVDGLVRAMENKRDRGLSSLGDF